MKQFEFTFQPIGTAIYNSVVIQADSKDEARDQFIDGYDFEDHTVEIELLDQETQRFKNI